jgi:tyrosine-protein kinase Etk/Wzc
MNLLAQIKGTPDATPGRWVPREVVSSCRPLFAQLHSELPLGSPLVLGISSPRRGTGRSTVALGLAAAAAAQLGTGRRVLLIDCDLENPALHTLCGVAPRAGLLEVLRGEVPVADAILPVMPGVSLLPTCEAVPDAVWQLKHMEESQFFVTLSSYFDAVLIDLPPVQTPSLGTLPPLLVPQLCLVARAAVTRRNDVKNALASFPLGQVTAVLLNEQRQRVPRWVDRYLS